MEKKSNTENDNMTHHTLKPWLLTAVLAIASLASCASSEKKAASQPTIERIEQRGKMLVGTTDDYRPLSFREVLLSPSRSKM